jgi:hypothetical protein
MFRPKWSSSGSRTCFVSYCTVIHISVYRCCQLKDKKLRVGNNIKYACEFLKIVFRNGVSKWTGIPPRHIIGHTTKISIAVLTIFYYKKQFLKIHKHILFLF